MPHAMMRFMRDEAGATAIEYAFIAAMIAMVIFAALMTIGPELRVPYANAAKALATGNANAH